MFNYSRSEPVQKWMQSVPKLLTNLRAIPDSGRGSKVVEVTLRVIQMMGIQGHGIFLESLQENSVDLLGKNLDPKHTRSRLEQVKQWK